MTCEERLSKLLLIHKALSNVGIHVDSNLDNLSHDLTPLHPEGPNSVGFWFDLTSS